jgi:hypothetical protein
MIHVLVITTIEEAELLQSVRGIVGGIDIEQDLSSFPDLFPTDLHKPIEKSILQLEEVAPTSWQAILTANIAAPPSQDRRVIYLFIRSPNP